MHIVIIEQDQQLRTFTGHVVARDDHHLVLRLAHPTAGTPSVVQLPIGAIVHEEQTAA